MNVNKTKKLLAARKRLKEFQKNRSNMYQDEIFQQEDLCKTFPAKSLHMAAEAPSPKDMTGNVTEQRSEIDGIPKEFPVTENLITSTDTNADSPTSNFEGTNEHFEVTSYSNKTIGINVPVKPSDIQHQTPERESIGDTQIRENDQEIRSHSETVEQFCTSSPKSPQPEQFGRFSDNYSVNATVHDAPSLQKAHLLQMASAVTDALHGNPVLGDTTSSETNCEYRNQFLSSCLDEQKQAVNRLHVQVSQYSSRIAELETILAMKDADFEAKLLQEVNPLNEQLQAHAQTAGILVGEKAELTAVIQQCQTIAQRKSEEVEELSGRLKNSQVRIVELGKELAHVKNTVDDTRKMYQELHLDYANLDKRYGELQKTKEDDALEVSELRQQIILKNIETVSLQRELEEKHTLLLLNDLKIQQLSSSPQETQTLENQHQTVTVLEQQLSQFRETLKTMNRDKEEAAKQYENYVRQLDARYENIVKDHEASKKTIEAFEDRERSYIGRLSDHEQSLQRERAKVEKLLPLQSHENRIDHLTKSLDALTLEHSNLQTILDKRDAKIDVLERYLEEMQESNEDTIDNSKLVHALQSEQLGASRAVAQNQQLKVQLGEMHDAFVTLSNSKLDLTEQLQGERAIGRKLNTHLNALETEINEIKEQLNKKDLTIQNMETEKLQTAQMADQMQHYQAQCHQDNNLQQELQNALSCIEILRRENHQLSMELNTLRLKQSENKNLSNSNYCLNEEADRKRVVKAVYSSIEAAKDGTAVLSDPLKKLEVRFTETMERVAELTDEKQRLEHLVLQLQGETETIGEYITLYQKQRAILQKRAVEREETFSQLIEQRNHQQEQLHKLKVLVADLILKKSVSTASQDPNLSPFIEFEKLSVYLEQGMIDNTVIDVEDKTTSKILDLLTEIKGCNNTCMLEPNFHPCAWCSGKLITV